MYKCELCEKEFEQKLGLTGHLMSCKKKHGLEPVKVSKPESKRPKYKELPPPIVEHLEITFGNWLNRFDVGQEWKEDFGGYAIYIKVPKEFSTEWKKQHTVLYDNKTGLEQERIEIEVPDVRWASLADLQGTKQWINRVKANIIEKAFSKGIQLPNTNAPLEEPNRTIADYEKSIHI